MSLVEIVTVVVAVLASATKFLGVTKAWWDKLPALAHYVPGFLVIAAVVVEKLQGLTTTNDVVNGLVALGLLVYGHFSKNTAPPAA